MSTIVRATEKSKIARLRRLASKNCEVFSKLRNPGFGADYFGDFILTYNNHVRAYFETLEEAEAHFAESSTV